MNRVNGAIMLSDNYLLEGIATEYNPTV